ncbi:YceI family protein [Emticicia sp. SJ17W-69]|uniref:YceI family protein n=1 Tax=Emticicia sp. SJ17W-69 TaxID=3421657 RepID=UPI003EBBF022
MKRYVILFLFSSLTVFSQTKYSISTTKNQLKWLGNSSLGGNGHDGFVKVSSGLILVSATNQIMKGNFEIDMNTIKSIDEKAKDKDKDNGLDEHLKSNDFFSVSKFPKAYFTIEQAKASIVQPNQYMVNGTLMIKGIANKIQFPAEIIFEGNNIKVKAIFFINRQLWGITYDSPSLFGFAKEAAIANEIKLTLDLIFEKQP